MSGASTCPSGEELPRSLRVLILDDNEEYLKVMGTYLTELGYTCFQAATLDQARDILDTEPVDVALLDFFLSGGQQSTELFHQIRRQWPQTKTFLVSGFLQFHELAPFLEGKLADQILLKPFSLEQLKMALVASFFGKSTEGITTSPSYNPT